MKGAQHYSPDWKSLDSRPVPGWFTDAKFGIFIHWGVYSVPSWRKVMPGKYASYAEWYYARVMFNQENGGKEFHEKNYGKDFDYHDFAPMFKAELFDPDFWAGLFARSGAKYVVLTSKHHDGYCLFPSTSPYAKNWNSMDTGPKRDLVGELTTAVRAKGLRMGLYYSIIEWESIPTKRTPSGYFIPTEIVKKRQIPADKYIDFHMIPQLKELVTNYQPALIFSDAGEWDRTAKEWKTIDFLAWLYNNAPNKDEVVVNDRWGSDMPGKHGDYFSSEYQDSDAVGTQHPWEESRGVGGSYGFNRAESIDDYNTSTELIHELVDIVSRGGNLLLNVGPTADGRIPVIMQERLLDIGAWLKVNGEAIYSTSPSNHSSKLIVDDNLTVYFTAKADTLYAICTAWPQTPIEIPGVKQSPARVTMLGLDQTVAWEYDSKSLILTITPPAISPAQVPCDHAYTFKICGVNQP